MTELDPHVSDVQAILADAGIDDIDAAIIKQRFEAYRDKQVPPSKVKPSVAKGLLRDHGVGDPDAIVTRHQTRAAVDSTSKATPIGDILDNGRGRQWYAIKAKFLQEVLLTAEVVSVSLLPERAKRALPEHREKVTFCMIGRSNSAATAE